MEEYPKASHSLQEMKELKRLWDEKQSPCKTASKAMGQRCKITHQQKMNEQEHDERGRNTTHTCVHTPATPNVYQDSKKLRYDEMASVSLFTPRKRLGDLSMAEMPVL